MKVSIITVCKNAEKTIKETIQSVFSQTYKDFEYIIIDGKSTDNTIAIINRYMDKLAYFISEPDNGVYAAMNKGIKQAKGDYCHFLNSGDYFYDNKVLENVFQENFDYDIMYGDALYTYADGSCRLQKYPDHLPYYFLYSSTICHQAQFIKRNLFLQYGLYDKDYKINGDYELLLRLVVKYNATYHHVNQIICRFSTVGLTSDTPEEFTLSERKMIQKLYFSTEILELLEEYSLLLNSDIVRLSRKIEKNKVVKKISKLFLKILQLIYNCYKLIKIKPYI